MQGVNSCQASPAKSDPIDLKPEDVVDIDDENTASPSTVIETKLCNVMPQGEMQILTRLFPKTARTLAGVLRNRAQLL